MLHGSIVPIIAAVVRRREEEEEEAMTKYNQDDLDRWEFKIVRSMLGRFSSRAFMERVCEEEAQAGWELVEKFDDQRVRFKRRIEKRSMDSHLDIDPYRTAVSSGSKPVVWVVVGLVLLLAGVAAFLINMNGRW